MWTDHILQYRISEKICLTSENLCGSERIRIAIPLWQIAESRGSSGLTQGGSLGDIIKKNTLFQGPNSEVIHGGFFPWWKFLLTLLNFSDLLSVVTCRLMLIHRNAGSSILEGWQPSQDSSWLTGSEVEWQSRVKQGIWEKHYSISVCLVFLVLYFRTVWQS